MGINLFRIHKYAIAGTQKEGLSAEFITEMLNAVDKESLRIEDNLKLK